MAFIKHTELHRRSAPNVSISPLGFLAFSEAVVRKHNLRSFRYAVMYYDPDSRTVGIEPTNDETSEGALKLRARTQGVYMSVKSFIDNFALPISVTTKYKISKDQDSDFLVFDIAHGRQRKPYKSRQPNGAKQAGKLNALYNTIDAFKEGQS